MKRRLIERELAAAAASELVVYGAAMHGGPGAIRLGSAGPKQIIIRFGPDAPKVPYALTQAVINRLQKSGLELDAAPSGHSMRVAITAPADEIKDVDHLARIVISAWCQVRLQEAARHSPSLAEVAEPET